MDERAGDTYWAVPPKCQRSPPGALADSDLRRGQPHGGFIFAETADAPDYYYRLLNEEWALPYFVVAGVSVNEFQPHLEELGLPPRVPSAPNDESLAIQVLLMGCSWSARVAG